MVAAFDFCLHGKGGAAPSIDTAMHGLVDAAHVDHLHPDRGIAIATAADGEQLTKEIFGDKVVWVPWRRPGFQLGLDIAAINDAQPAGDRRDPRRPRHHRVGRRPATRPRRTRCGSSTTAQALHRRRTATPQPFGAGRRRASSRCPTARAPREGRGAAPRIRGARLARPAAWSATSPTPTWCSSSSPREKLRALAALGTSCPDHFLRTKVKPLVLDLPADAPLEDVRRSAARSCTSAYRADYRPTTSATPTPDSPADARRRPGDRARARRRHVLATARTSRPPASPASSTSTPSTSCAAPRPSRPTRRSPRREKFRIEYWALEEAKLQRHAEAQAATPAASRSSPARPAASARRSPTRLAAEGACVVVADLDADKAPAAAAELGGTDVAIGVAVDVTDADAGRRPRSTPTLLAFGGIDLVVNNAGLSISKPLLETTEQDWDLQHDVMAKGSFLVVAGRGAGDDRPGTRRRHRLHRLEERASSPGPNNIAYSAAKADQAHQVRLLAAELGEHGIRVNGINPDGVVRGSGIFAGGWGAQRAAVYGVPEEELGEFYAQRTLLKREVLPEHVADAVVALASDELQPHHRAARPRRRRRRRRLPALSADDAARGLRRGRPRRVRRPGHGRHRRAATTIALERRSTASPTAGRGCATATCAGTSPGCRRGARRARAARRASTRRSSRSASTPGASTTACSTPTARCSASPIAYRDDRTGDGHRRRARARRRRTSCTRINGLQFLPFNTHLPARRRAARRRCGRAPRTSLLLPDLLALLADRRAAAPSAPTRRRPACSTSRTRQWSTELLDAARHPARRCSRRSIDPGDRRARCAGRRSRLGLRAERRDDRRLARHRVGRRRRARRRPTLRLHRPAARGRSSASSSTQPVLTEARRAGELHQRGRRRRSRSASSATSAACGSCRSACAELGGSTTTSASCSPTPAALRAGGPRHRRRRPDVHRRPATCPRASPRPPAGGRAD